MARVRVPVESLRKGLDLLEILCGPEAGRDGVPLAVLAERLSLKRSTAHNLLKTLCVCGFAGNVGDGRYRPGWKVPQIGRQALLGDAGVVAVTTVAAEISVALGEAVVVAVLVAGRRRVVARASGTQAIRVDARTADGGDRPIWSTVTGRVLAAFCGEDELAQVLQAEGLPTAGAWPGVTSRRALAAVLAAVREAHGAEDQGNGVASLAVPVLSGNGSLLAAVGTFLPGFRYGPGERDHLLAGLRSGAARLGETLARAGSHEGAAIHDE